MRVKAGVGAGHPTVRAGCLPFFHDFLRFVRIGFLSCDFRDCPMIQAEHISQFFKRNEIILKPCN